VPELRCQPNYGASLLNTLNPNPILTNASSSACKNRDRSALAKGAGPPPTPSIPARRSAMMARVAMAPPMDALVNAVTVTVHLIINHVESAFSSYNLMHSHCNSERR
jgi:hypothetical protein